VKLGKRNEEDFKRRENIRRQSDSINSGVSRIA